VLTQKDIDELDKDQKFLKANGMIEKEVNVKDLILPSAVK